MVPFKLTIPRKEKLGKLNKVTKDLFFITIFNKINQKGLFVPLITVLGLQFFF